MITDSSLQRTLLGVSTLGEHDYLLNLASFILYLDIIFSWGKVPLSMMSVDWIMANITLGDAVVFLLGYVFLRAFLLPMIALVFVLTTALPLALWVVGKFVRRGWLDDYVFEPVWFEYSILSKNTPAYRELENVRREKDAALVRMKASFSLTVIVILDILFMSRQTIAADVAEFLQNSSPVVGWLCALALCLFLFVVVMGWLMAPFSWVTGVKVKTSALKAEIESVVRQDNRG